MLFNIRCSFVVLFLVLLAAPSHSQQSVVIQPDRVAHRPDLDHSVPLQGYVPSWASAVSSGQAVPADAPLRFSFLLARSPELQAEFTKLLADQQDPTSPSFHQWLTPQQVGVRFGPTQHDLDTFSTWLTSQGLTVLEVAPSRVFVTVEASTATVARALRTSFKAFAVKGTLRRSPLTDPAIPTAFAQLVSSVSGLAEVEIEPMQHSGSMSISGSRTFPEVRPQYTSPSGVHFVTPADFAIIFDLNAVYQAGYDGTGQRVAIIGRSRVVLSDITEFETSMGLPSNLPTTVIPASGVDPGLSGNGDEGEATLDLDRVIGTAPGVGADLVVSGSANGYNGLYVAAQYEVQSLLDPIMTISFGSCEAYAGAANVSLWDALFSQAASEGISVFVSSADSGAATCDGQFAVTPAYQIRSINYICASSYATCVGATEFADTANPGQFWSAGNSVARESARSYIPEGAWNEPLNGTNSYVAAASGGGSSIYVPKPVWQAGTGVPADGARDVPDVSFPGAAHDAYYACYAAGNGDCAQGRFEFFYGTSAAAPAMAAVAALLNQKTGGSHGNLNPLLYRTAATSPAALHDATPVSSGVTNCDVTLPSMCNNSTPGPNSLAGGLAGFALTPGYDQATGLGSLDVNSFLDAASAAKPLQASTSLTITGSPSSISNAQTATFTATLSSPTSGIPAGFVQFFGNAAALGSPVPVVAGKASSGAVHFPAAGTYYITASYSGDSTYAPTVSPGVSLLVTGLRSATNISAPNTAIPVGTSAIFRVTVQASSGLIVPTGSVHFYLSNAAGGSFVITVPLADGTSTTPPVPFPTPGSYTLTAEYLGDSVFSSSNSSGTALTVQRVGTATQLTTTGATVGIGGSKSFMATVVGVISNSTAPAPTGTVQLYANGIALGSRIAVAALSGQLSQSTSLAETFSQSGDYIVTAVYSGDALWLPSTATGIALMVDAIPASFQLTAASTSLSVAAGASGANTDLITVTPIEGFAGVVNLTCSVSYNGAGPVTNAPTCALVSNTATVQPNGLAASSTLTIATAAPRAGGNGASLARTDNHGGGWRAIAGQTAFCALVMCLISPRRHRAWRTLPIVGIAAVSLGLAGCGSTANSAVTPGTTAGSYTVTVTGFAVGIPLPQAATIQVTVR